MNIISVPPYITQSVTILVSYIFYKKHNFSSVLILKMTRWKGTRSKLSLLLTRDGQIY